MNDNKTNINYYPGHMAKTKRQIIENINLIDIVYEVIDARAPYSTKIKDIEDIIKNKSRILIINKKDLCDINVTNKWKEKYENEGYKVLVIDLKDNKDYKKIIDETIKCTKSIQEKRISKGLKPKEIKALVIGVPNVGKSTLINKMVGKKVASVENRAGVTKHLNFLPTNFGITLLDTPGILWPKFEDQTVAKNIAAIGSIKKEVLNLFDISSYIIETYIKYYSNIITDIYKVEGNSSLEVLDNLAKKWGFIKNNEVDYNKTCERIYNDLNSGKIIGVSFDR